MSFFRLIVFIKLLLFIAFTQGKEDVFKPKEKPQSGDFGNVFEELFFSDNSGEPEFLEENADFSQINATHLLEVQFINRSLLHYQKKANQVQSSLKNRVTDLLNSFRQVHSSEKLFSPLYSAELQQKLNATVANLFTTLDLSPICWASLRLILSDLKHKKLWPLKCNFSNCVIYIVIQLMIPPSSNHSHRLGETLSQWSFGWLVDLSGRVRGVSSCGLA